MPLPNWTRQQFIDYAKSDPAGAQAMYDQYQAEQAQIRRQSILNQQEAAKGPTNNEQLTQAIGGPLALIGGLKAGQYLFGSGGLAGGGGSALASGATGAGLTSAAGTAGAGLTGAAGTAGAATGAGATGTALAGEGLAGSLSSLGGSLGSVAGVPVLPALAAVGGSWLLDRGAQGLLGNKKNTAGGLALRGVLGGPMALSWAGLDYLRKGGHGKNYYAAKDRNKILSGIQKQYGPLNFKTPSGGAFALDPKSFEKDPNTYNYDQSSKTMATDIGAANPLSYLLTGEKVGSKKFTDVAGALANASKAGVSANDLYSKVGLGYRNAFDKIQADSKLSAEDKAAFLNGLDQAFQQGTYAPKRKKK